jgi:CHAT domain-containing protein
MFHLLAAAVLAATLHVPAPDVRSEVAPLVTTFIETLRSGDPTRLAKSIDLLSANVETFRDLLESDRCATVDAYQYTVEQGKPGTVTVTVAVDGSAELRGRRHKVVRLPRRFVLTLVRNDDAWRLVGAEAGDRTIARTLWQARDDAARRAILATGDRTAILRAAAELASHVTCGPDEEVLQFAENEAARDDDLATVAWIHRMRSRYYLYSHDMRRAVKEARDGIQTATAAGDPDMLAETRFALGILSWLDGDTKSALAELARSAQYAPLADDPRPAVRALYMKSYILTKHDLHAALAAADECSAVAAEYGSRRTAVDVLFLRAMQLEELADSASAARVYRTILGLAPALLSVDVEDNATVSLADSDAAQGNFREARTLLETICAKTHPPTYALIALAKVLIRQGDDDAAERRLRKAFEEALRSEQQREAAAILTYTAELRLLRHRDAEALQLAQEALVAAARPELTKNGGGEEFAEWETRTVAARALRRLGRQDEAIAQLRRALEIIEENRSELGADAVATTRYFEQKVAPYLELTETLVAAGRFDEALKVAEESKARTLLDVTSAGRIDPSPLFDAGDRDRERQLERTVARLNRERMEGKSDVAGKLEAARYELDEFKSELYLRHPALRMRRADLGNGSTPALPGGMVALEYVVGPSQTTLFCVHGHAQGSRVRAYVLPIGARELGRRVAALTRSVSMGSLDYRVAARRLYRTLIAPAAGELTHASTIVVVGDGILWRLPFQMLRMPDGRDLLDLAPIFYAPSLAVLSHLMKSSGEGHAGSSLLVFGDPALPPATDRVLRVATRGRTLGPLPDAVWEAREIGAMYPGAHILVRKQATETAFKELASSNDVIHIAAHALVDDRQPMYSSIVMSRDASGDDDGLLEARELAEMNLKARLVVLSACETAGSGVAQGEGLMGLSWALLMAGCQTTVVSQWSVTSRATALLMRDFHRHLQAHESPAVALRHAQLALRSRKELAHPLYWAPFVVIGAP